jgi:hypothetical protein
VYIQMKVSEAIKEYSKLCRMAQIRASTRKEANALLGCVHGHHIIPKSIRHPSKIYDKDWNRAYFTPEEHFDAHVLLAIIYPAKMGRVIHRMKTNKRSQERFDRETYAQAMRQLSETMKGKPSWNAGKKLSPSHIENNRLSRIGKPSKLRGTKLSPEVRAKISQAKLGKKRAPFSMEARKNMSESHKGKVGYWKGKTGPRAKKS